MSNNSKFFLFGIGVLMTFSSAMADEWVYTVRPGDSLWKISNEYLISPEYWPKVQQLNGVEDVLELPPGQRLTIPVAWLKKHPSSIKVVSAYGQVERLRAQQVEPLSQDSDLAMGDGVRTGKSGSIRLAFDDGAEVLVLPQTEIVLELVHPDSASSNGRIVVKIIKGRVENKVEPRSGRRYEVYTPAAVAAVRGTEFRVAAENNGEFMQSEVLVGNIDVSGHGVTHNIAAGYASVAKLGEPPSAPIALPAAPDLSALASSSAQADIHFTWPAAFEAVQYRALLARDELFSSVMRQALLDSPKVQWTGLSPASYYMRVNAINNVGIEGFNATHKFTITKPLRSPVGLIPGDNTEFIAQSPFIAWSNMPDASFYILQLANNAQFTKGLQEVTGIVNNNFTPHALPPGHYYWRVQSVNANNDKSAFSKEKLFIIREAAE